MSGQLSKQLCSACQDVISWSKAQKHELDEREILDYQPSYQALQDSATTCPLCHFVLHTALSDLATSANYEEQGALQYKVIVFKEKGVGKDLYSIRWRGTPSYPSPYVGDTRGYYFAHAASKEGSTRLKVVYMAVAD